MNQVESEPKTASSRRLDIALGVIGKTFIATGLLLLLFVAYQLWGTGLATERAQDSLRREFTSQLPAVPTYGSPVTRLQIDTLGVDKIVIAGADYKSLEKGPGLFDGSPLPGQLGNVAIAGHRTSYGAPFARINELKVGDTITLTRAGSTFTYVVKEKPFIVRPTSIEVVKTLDKNIAELTLVTCHPKWTSQNRLIVKATLDSTVTPQQPTTFTQTSTALNEVLETGWFREPAAIPGAVGFAALLLLIFAAASWYANRGRNPWLIYSIGALAFAPTLFVFFGYLTRLLPANL